MADRLNHTLQENIITLLAFDAQHGRIIRELVTPDLFEGDYRIIAERCFEYWRTHQQPPRKHTFDLVVDATKDERHAETMRRMTAAMIDLSENINADYVMSKVHAFARMQHLRQAILQSAEAIQHKEDLAIEEVESLWSEVLRSRDFGYQPTLRLTEVDRILNYLQARATEFATGIPELDKRFIVPARGEVLLFLAPSGEGKSWFLIHLGHTALQDRLKVCHISLEMSAEAVGHRYYQMMFGVPKRPGHYTSSKLGRTEQDVVNAITPINLTPEFTFASELVRDEVVNRLLWLGARGENLTIQRFPMRTLTIDGLRGFLDNLEAMEKFIPDLLVLDYVGLMKTDMRDHRLSLGRTMEDLRGLATQRNIAVVTAQQVQRSTGQSGMIRAHHVAEDWSLIATSDIVLTYNRTTAEKDHGLARLYVAKSRNETDKFAVLLTQNYATGQFVIESAMMDQYYERYIEALDAPPNENEAKDDAGSKTHRGSILDPEA